MPIVSAAIRDELRRFIAVKALSIIFSRGQMTLRSMWSAIDDLYHGNVKKKIFSQVDQLINYQRPYSELFERREDLIGTFMTGSGPENVYCYVLKPDICRSEAPIIVGSDITKSVLEKTSFKKCSTLVTGKTLVRLAQDSLRNIKKAIALIPTLDSVQSFTSVDGITCKSGRTLLDVKEELLDKMFELLQGKTSFLDESDDDEDTADNIKDNDDTKKDNEKDNNKNIKDIDIIVSKSRSKSWMFCGWFALCIFGPFGDEKDRLSLLDIGQGLDDKKKKSSRTAARAVASKEKDDCRTNNVGIVSSKAGGIASDITSVQRGLKSTVAFTQQISLANLAVKREEQDQAEKDSRVFAINAEMKSQTLKIDRLERRAIQYDIAYDMNNKIWKDIDTAETRIAELEIQLSTISNTTTNQDLKRSHLLFDQLMDDNIILKKRASVPTTIESTFGSSTTPESRITMETNSFIRKIPKNVDAINIVNPLSSTTQPLSDDGSASDNSFMKKIEKSMMKPAPKKNIEKLSEEEYESAVEGVVDGQLEENEKTFY